MAKTRTLGVHVLGASGREYFISYRDEVGGVAVCFDPSQTVTDCEDLRYGAAPGRLVGGTAFPDKQAGKHG